MLSLARPIRHIVNVFVQPWLTALLLLAAALILGLLGRTTARRWLAACAALLAYLGSTSLVGRALLAPLESEYPALEQAGTLPAVSYVVVLGSDYNPRDRVPITAALDADGLARIVEGIRLVRRLANAKLVVSGGAPAYRVPPAQGYAMLARELGVPAASVVVSDRALDTTDEARNIAQLLAHAPFLLVTSASHMPRAMRLMRLAGANPIAAPTLQRADAGAQNWWDSLLPSPDGLESTQRALHEYLALAALAAGFD